MAFITFNVQYQNIKYQMNRKNYELDTVSRTLEGITKHLTDLKATKSEKDLQNNGAYQDLVAYEMAYDTKKESLESELEVLKNQANSYKDALKNNIQKSVKWSCFSK